MRRKAPRNRAIPCSCLLPLASAKCVAACLRLFEPVFHKFGYGIDVDDPSHEAALRDLPSSARSV